MLFMSVILLGLVFSYSFFRLYQFACQIERQEQNGKLCVLLPAVFLLVLMLYCFPLPIRLMQDGVEHSGVYHDVSRFIGYIPPAIILVSMFILVFLIVYKATYVSLSTYRHSAASLNQYYPRMAFKIIWGLFLLLATAMLLKLSVQAGGLHSLILSGYAVTGLLSENAGYAVAFSWVTSLSLLAFAYGLSNGSKLWTFMGVLLILICVISFVIMGRRGALVVISLAALIVHALCYKRLGYMAYIVIIAMGFLALNFVGLLRGASYDSLVAFYDSTIDRYSYVSEVSDVGFLYTLTDGNFVIPFQTLPNIMSRLDNLEDFSFGGVTASSLLLLVPSFLWADRPLPLANWYMIEFVDSNAALNEGRQFFFISESYLNFGPLGVLFWGIGYGVLLAGLASYFQVKRKSYVHIVLFSLIVGNMLSFVAADTVGGVVAFFKNYGFPCLLMLGFAYFVRLRNRFNVR